MPISVESEATRRLPALRALLALGFAARAAVYVAEDRLDLLPTTAVLLPLAVVLVVGLWKLRTVVSASRDRAVFAALAGFSSLVPTIAPHDSDAHKGGESLLVSWTGD